MNKSANFNFYGGIRSYDVTFIVNSSQKTFKNINHEGTEKFINEKIKNTCFTETFKKKSKIPVIKFSY